MVNTVKDAPNFDASAAAAIAHDVYAVDAIADPLPSERDQNFLLTDARGERCVLKIASATESRAVLEAQQAAMAHVAARLPLCPRPLATRRGDVLETVKGRDGREHLVWSITYLTGRPLGTVRRRS